MHIDSVAEALLPVLPAEGTVIVTGNMADMLTDHIESQPLSLSVYRCSMADILSGALDNVPHTAAVVISDFRKVDPNHRTVTIRSLGYLRDRSVAKVLHLIINTPLQPQWSLRDSLSLGFVRRAATDTDTLNFALDEFTIENYKSEPDWLNAKDWAHPHLW